MKNKISTATQEIINALRTQGVRFTIITPVDYRVELHNERVNELTGEVSVDFVAELDSYGNITECGPILSNGIPNIRDKNVVLNADGEQV